ncbi:MAG: methyltransferase domain-containing protein [Candidatus Limnocylindrales bacterium]
MNGWTGYWTTGTPWSAIFGTWPGSTLWLGGCRLSARAIDALLAIDRAAARRAAEGPPVMILDIGTGGADIPLALLARDRARGRSTRIVGLDSRAEILAAAIVADPRAGTTCGLTLELGDGRSLPYPDGSFDIAHTSLVLHHLAPAEVDLLLREMARVVRRGIVVNDLARSRPALVGAWLLGHLLTTDRFTRHDAPMSVRRAYTLSEAVTMVQRAGLRVVATERGVLGHRWAIAAEPATPPRLPERSPS